MPPVIFGALVSAALPASIATASVIPGVTGITVGGLLTSALSMGATMGLSALLAPKPKTQTQQAQITPRDSNPRRMRGYGRVKMAGPTVFFDSVMGSIAIEITAHCEGGPYGIDGYEEQWWNDKKGGMPPGTLVGSAGIDPYYAFVQYESHLGTPGQAASSLVQANFPGVWTEDHKLSGIAYTVTYALVPPKPEKTFQLTYPNGRPGFRTVARLLKVWDYRTLSRSWSPNSSLCIGDFMTYERTNQLSGISWAFMKPEHLDEDSFAAFADICDEDIPLSGGGTEKRYELHGLYEVSEPVRDTLAKMRATCDAEFVQDPATGKVGIRGGILEEPIVTLTEEDFISFRYRQGNGRLANYNKLIWTYVQKENDYQTVQGEAWEDIQAQQEAGEVRTKEVALDFVTSHSQGRRLCKRIMAKENPRHVIEGAVVKLPALALIGEIVVRVQFQKPLLNEVFQIKRMVPAGDLKTTMLDLWSVASDIDDWDPELEEGSPPPVPPEYHVGTDVPEPQDPNATIVRLRLAGGAIAAKIRVDVNPLPPGEWTPYWTLIGRIRLASGTDDDYVPMVSIGAQGVISDDVEDGETYRWQVAWTGMGVTSDWTDPQDTLVTSDPTAPNPPPTLPFTAVPGGAGEAVLTWKTSASKNTYATAIYRNTSATLVGATELDPQAGGPNIVMSITDAGLSAGDYYYWIAAQNASGVTSSTIGPKHVVVT